jgi:putative chitinase
MSFTFTTEQLQSVIGNNYNLDGWHAALSSVLPKYEIDSPQRVAAFIAQCTHESGGFKRLKENLNYIST